MSNKKAKAKATKQTVATNDETSKTFKIRPVEFLTENQKLLYESIRDKEITIVTGSPGTGKTFLSLYSALRSLGPKYKKIILVKSVTTLPSEEIGFLKGSLEDKMTPFMMSFTGNIQKLVGERVSDQLFKDKIIEVLPLAYIRGLSIDDSIVLIDETQNTDVHTFKSIITRIGTNSKYVFLGDTEQIDRKDKQSSCLEKVIELFRESNKIGTVEFLESDCVRNPIIPYLLEKIKTIE